MRLKKYIAILLTAVMLFNIIPILPYVDAAGTGHTEYNQCTELDPTSTTSISVFQAAFDKIKNELPINTPLVNPKKPNLYLNFKLWHDKNIVVYGSYKSVSNNPFDNCTQPTGTTTKILNQGYYKSTSGLSGEYRYHGYDIAGNPYSNINFRNDANMAGTKHWLQQPWANKKMSTKIWASPYDDAADGGDAPTIAWINKTFDTWKVTNGFNADGDEISQTGGFANGYSFIHVMTAPGLMHPGEGRMWHKEKETGATVWYQTFTIPKLENKLATQRTPVGLTMQILSTPAELTTWDTDDPIQSNVKIPVKAINK